MTNDLLIVFDEKNVAAIFKKDAIAPYLKDVRERALSIVPADVNTEEGRKELKSIARRIASSKVALDEAGKTLVADIKNQVGEIDAERKIWRDEMDKLRDEIRKPADDWDAKEKTRIDDHEAILSQLANITSFPAGTTSDQIAKKVIDIEAYKQRDWQEFKEKADAMIAQKAFDLGGLFAEKKLAEDTAAENARLRKEKDERDAKDLKEANEKAQKERDEKIANDAIETERLRIQKEKDELAAKQAQLSTAMIALPVSSVDTVAQMFEQAVPAALPVTIVTVSTGPAHYKNEQPDARQLTLAAVRAILLAYYPDEHERATACAIELVTSVQIGAIPGLRAGEES